MRRQFKLAATAAMISLLGFAGVASAEEKMTGDELNTLFGGGATMFVTTSSGKPYIAVLSADGGLRAGLAKFKDGNGNWKAKKNGKWWTEDGRYCSKFGKTNCIYIYTKGSDGKYIYENVNNSKRGKINRIIAGDKPDG